MRNAFGVVDEFERRVADYAGAKFAVATDCCTNAIFLCCKLRNVREVKLPARTYISVPMAVIHAGGTVDFVDYEWSGVYQLMPYDIWDGAKRFKRGMYQGGLHCLSFHAKKLVNIGKGGMILTDSFEDYEWLRKARYDGRSGLPYDKEKVVSLGWHYYMQPPEAGRGLMLLDVLPENLPDQSEDYPDLRKQPVFQLG